MSLIVMPGTDLRRGPSPHLSFKELGCNDGTPYPMKYRKNRAVILANEFEAIRELAGGKAIKINSAYRTKSWNRRVGGSRKSQHVMARALDLGLPIWVTLSEFRDIVIAVADRAGSKIRGIGVYKTFIHFDVRPGERLARWKGSRVAAELGG